MGSPVPPGARLTYGRRPGKSSDGVVGPRPGPACGAGPNPFLPRQPDRSGAGPVRHFDESGAAAERPAPSEVEAEKSFQYNTLDLVPPMKDSSVPFRIDPGLRSRLRTGNRLRPERKAEPGRCPRRRTAEDRGDVSLRQRECGRTGSGICTYYLLLFSLTFRFLSPISTPANARNVPGAPRGRSFRPIPTADPRAGGRLLPWALQTPGSDTARRPKRCKARPRRRGPNRCEKSVPADFLQNKGVLRPGKKIRLTLCSSDLFAGNGQRTAAQ